MTALTTLAAWLSDLDYRGLSMASRDATRQRIFDTLGATVVGLATEEGQLLRRLDAHLLEPNRTPAGTDRCRLLVAATRTTEIDDIDIVSCTTAGSVVVPLALSITASRPSIDDRDLIIAIVAGYEAMIRLGRAIDGANLIYKGVWPSYVTAAFASAATTAKLLGLDARCTANALALALSRTNPLARNALAQPAYRHYALGCAAVDGCVAAFAASAGLNGAEDCIETFGSAIRAPIDTAELTRDLSAQPKISQVDTKLFPSSRQALASVEAFRQQLPLPQAIEDIESISVYVPSAYRNMVDQPRLPKQRIESMLGVQYQMALAAIGSDSFYDALRAAPQENTQVESLMHKITVLANEQLSARFPQTWGSQVCVRWKSGEESTTEVLDPKGSARQPLSWNEIQEKLECILAAGHICPDRTTDDLMKRCQVIGKDSAKRISAELLQQLDLLCEYAALTRV